MGVGGYFELLGDIEAAGLSNEFDYAFLSEKVRSLINEKDNFMANPLEFVLSPQSKYYNDNCHSTSPDA